MPLLPTTLAYPASEIPKLEALRQLFQDWLHASVEAAPEMKEQIEGMVFDGFYPHYFSRKTRILFIGREAREIEGFNYLDLLHAAYRTGKRIGSQHLNCNLFHRRMLYMAYGLLNGLLEWKEIPDADQIGDSFATAEGVSFAFMNLSKFSNESEFWPSNWRMIGDAVRLATQTRNFIAEEVAILQPEIVITMNLGDYFSSFGQEVTPLASASRDVSSWTLMSNGHKALLLDCFHFSAPGKRDLDHYYLPIAEVVKLRFGG
ncbi:MAG TPA: hypothetical protein DIT13_13910 [Verrucomicrobiales bacterium]|nr:hypothetical protein [Verrucomicrobiales bacterium]HRJ08759.1 hypothetical protein [Prosthecobacter sp.]HRK14318.1 hypothetical protein [Prosthecobacter sp.]